jgi:hypothetical protein
VAAVGLLWRAEWDASTDAETCRLHVMFAAFRDLGVEARSVVYSDDRVEEVRAQLAVLDGVLVWVNPVQQGRDRSLLDPLLRDAAGAGVFVSAHPDVIGRMATKQVLVDTAGMSWSAGTHLYRTHEQLAAELPDRLARGPLVLKQERGMGGAGVWKVEAVGAGEVRVQHAEGGAAPSVEPLESFLARCAPYFAGGLMVEQPFQRRLAEGMIRVYLCHDAVVGFAHQYPRGLLDPEVAAGLPGAKVFEPPTAPAYQPLRRRMEGEWVGELQKIAGVPRDELPVIWDADFLLGEDDGYVLCEMNASSTFAFPEHAMPAVARAALERISSRSGSPAS